MVKPDQMEKMKNKGEQNQPRIDLISCLECIMSPGFPLHLCVLHLWHVILHSINCIGSCCLFSRNQKDKKQNVFKKRIINGCQLSVTSEDLWLSELSVCKTWSSLIVPSQNLSTPFVSKWLVWPFQSNHYLILIQQQKQKTNQINEKTFIVLLAILKHNQSKIELEVTEGSC